MSSIGQILWNPPLPQTIQILDTEYEIVADLISGPHGPVWNEEATKVCISTRWRDTSPVRLHKTFRKDTALQISQEFTNRPQKSPHCIIVWSWNHVFLPLPYMYPDSLFFYTWIPPGEISLRSSGMNWNVQNRSVATLIVQSQTEFCAGEIISFFRNSKNFMSACELKTTRATWRVVWTHMCPDADH